MSWYNVIILFVILVKYFFLGGLRDPLKHPTVSGRFKKLQINWIFGKFVKSFKTFGQIKSKVTVRQSLFLELK